MSQKYSKKIVHNHNGPIEIIPNFFIGSMIESELMIIKHDVDVLVPLDSVNGKIWDLGFRGKILYYPIKDFSILPDDILSNLLNDILTQLHQGKKVGLFCIGGHGRTGYIASIILGILGINDPIAFLRKYYCGEAVETNEQIKHIAQRLNKPELIEKYKIEYQNYYDSLFNYQDYNVFLNE